jgi:hypothetical protein
MKDDELKSAKGYEVRRRTRVVDDFHLEIRMSTLGEQNALLQARFLQQDIYLESGRSLDRLAYFYLINESAADQETTIVLG